MPIHLDIMFDLTKSFQAGIRMSWPEGPELYVSQQTNRFILFLRQDFSLYMIQSNFNRDYMSTEIGFGIRFPKNKEGGVDLPHLDEDITPNLFEETDQD